MFKISIFAEERQLHRENRCRRKLKLLKTRPLKQPPFHQDDSLARDSHFVLLRNLNAHPARSATRLETLRITLGHKGRANSGGVTSDSLNRIRSSAPPRSLKMAARPAHKPRRTTSLRHHTAEYGDVNLWSAAMHRRFQFLSLFPFPMECGHALPVVLRCFL